MISKEFTRSFRGYDCKEVDEYLETLQKEHEEEVKLLLKSIYETTQENVQLTSELLQASKIIDNEGSVAFHLLSLFQVYSFLQSKEEQASADLSAALLQVQKDSEAIWQELISMQNWVNSLKTLSTNYPD